MTGTLISEQLLSSGSGGVAGQVLDLTAAPPLPASYATLTADELSDFIEAVTEADAELREPQPVSDAVLEEALPGDDDGDPFTGYTAAHDAAYAAGQARQDARDTAILQDTVAPARRDEDKMSRAVTRASQGLYGTPYAASLANEIAAIELAGATGSRPCGPVDEYGRCASRYHALGCAHGTGVDWLAEAGAPRQTYAAALANTASGSGLSGSAVSIWDDPDDLDDPDAEPATVIPLATIELAHGLAAEWGLFEDSPFGSAPAYGDLLRPPAAPVTAYDAMAESIGYGSPQPDQPSYPGVSELAERMGLK